LFKFVLSLFCGLLLPLLLAAAALCFRRCWRYPALTQLLALLQNNQA
jgi:hypothetical protein